jgi:hypothetical protein
MVDIRPAVKVLTGPTWRIYRKNICYFTCGTLNDEIVYARPH